MRRRLSFSDEKIEEWLLVAALVFIVFIVCAQVIFRYVFNFSLSWSEEISRYVLIWIAWISASYAVRTKSHIRVEVIKNLFSSGVQKGIEVIVLVLWFLFALFLAVEGTSLVLRIESMGQVSPSNEIPMWIIYLAVPIGGTLMCLRVIQQAIFILFPNRNREES